MKPWAAAIVAAAVLILALATSNRGELEPESQSGRGVVDQPAAPTAPPAPIAEPSATGPARAALSWQLAVENGQSRPVPAAVFTEQLAAELARRPPARAPGSSLARVVRLRELKSHTRLRQLVATIRRGQRTEYVNVLLDCERRCRVAGIQ